MPATLAQILTPDSPLPPSVRATGPLILGNAVSNAAADAFGGEAVYAAITAFLSRGEAPVYLGWGSMAVPGKELVTKSVLALKKVRGVAESETAQKCSCRNESYCGAAACVQSGFYAVSRPPTPGAADAIQDWSLP